MASSRSTPSLPESPLVAEMRGMALHDLRCHLRYRHEHLHGTYHRICCHGFARENVQLLRKLGPGPVVMPETCGGGRA